MTLEYTAILYLKGTHPDIADELPCGIDAEIRFNIRIAGYLAGYDEILCFDIALDKARLTNDRIAINGNSAFNMAIDADVATAADLSLDGSIAAYDRLDIIRVNCLVDTLLHAAKHNRPSSPFLKHLFLL